MNISNIAESRNTPGKLTVAIDQDDGTSRIVTITGRRNCETLQALLDNPAGISSLDRWAFGWRLSHYVYRLRCWGLEIETRPAVCGDVHYGIYRLKRRVTIIRDGREAV